MNINNTQLQYSTFSMNLHDNINLQAQGNNLPNNNTLAENLNTNTNLQSDTNSTCLCHKCELALDIKIKKKQILLLELKNNLAQIKKKEKSLLEDLYTIPETQREYLNKLYNTNINYFNNALEEVNFMSAMKIYSNVNESQFFKHITQWKKDNYMLNIQKIKSLEEVLDKEVCSLKETEQERIENLNQITKYCERMKKIIDNANVEIVNNEKQKERIIYTKSKIEAVKLSYITSIKDNKKLKVFLDSKINHLLLIAIEKQNLNKLRDLEKKQNDLITKYQKEINESDSYAELYRMARDLFKLKSTIEYTKEDISFKTKTIEKIQEEYCEREKQKSNSFSDLEKLQNDLITQYQKQINDSDSDAELYRMARDLFKLKSQIAYKKRSIVLKDLLIQKLQEVFHLNDANCSLKDVITSISNALIIEEELLTNLLNLQIDKITVEIYNDNVVEEHRTIVQNISTQSNYLKSMIKQKYDYNYQLKKQTSEKISNIIKLYSQLITIINDVVVFLNDIKTIESLIIELMFMRNVQGSHLNDKNAELQVEEIELINSHIIKNNYTNTQKEVKDMVEELLYLLE